MDSVFRELQRTLEPLDDLNLGCEGTSWLISSLLQRKSVEHMLMNGSISHISGRVVVPHVWIAMGPWIVDFRVRMWFGRHNTNIPHGCFLSTQAKNKGFIYNGVRANDLLIPWTDALEISDSVVYDIDRSRLFEQVVDEFGSHENKQGELW